MEMIELMRLEQVSVCVWLLTCPVRVLNINGGSSSACSAESGDVFAWGWVGHWEMDHVDLIAFNVSPLGILEFLILSTNVG